MRVSIRQPNPGIANGFLEADNRGLTDRAQAVWDLLVVALRAYRKAVADLNPAAVFHRSAPMNYQAFTNDSLTMMYEGIRGAMAADDALKRQGMEIRFRVRVTPDWKKHAGELESEMLKRGMFFDVIDWSEDQATLPFEE
jgi:hypothetical protein